MTSATALAIGLGVGWFAGAWFVYLVRHWIWKDGFR